MATHVKASYLLAVAGIFIILYLKLIPALFAGLAVYLLTIKLTGLLSNCFSATAHRLALTIVALAVIAVGIAGGIGIWCILGGQQGVGILLQTLAETLDNLRRQLPDGIAALIPETVESLKAELVILLKKHAQHLSAVGVEGLKALTQILLGMVIGGMAVLQKSNVDSGQPLATALADRTSALVQSFDKVVLAQLKISLVNTVLTSFYLLAILPLTGIRLPLVTVLIPLTMIAGMIPVVGNLISNSAIIMVSFTVSPAAALGSLAFLVLVHKLEYFLNTAIIGHEVQAQAWELLCAMILLEAMFGICGLVAAPALYAWLKEELRANALL